MIRMSANMDTSGFQRSLKELAKLKKDAPKVVKRVAGNVVKDCVKLTPPFGGHAFTETFGAQLKVGRGAVDADIRKVFYAVQELDAVKARTKGSIGWNLWKAAKLGTGQTVLQILENMKLRPTSFGPSPTEAQHASVRDRRGRTKSNRGSFWVPTSAVLNAYIKTVQAHVGKAKHGWMSAVSKLGVRGIPGWVTRQQSTSGTCTVSGEGTLNFAVEFENTVPFIQQKGRELGIMKAAFKSVGNKLQKEVDAIMASRFRKAKRA